MTATVDPELCIGCTLCVQTCPQVFRMESDKAIAYLDPVPEGLADLCRRAAQECPVEAIRVDV